MQWDGYAIALCVIVCCVPVAWGLGFHMGHAADRRAAVKEQGNG